MKEFLSLEKRNEADVSVHLITDKQMRGLHKTYFDDESPTDCISFPIDDEILGDVFVCPKTALLYAEKNQKDPYEEIALYIIHGLLHLIGYDDLQEEERKKMRRAETKHLRNLRKGVLT